MQISDNSISYFSVLHTYSLNINVWACVFCLFTVPSPVVEVTSIDTVEYGEAVTLKCNAITVRGITSSVDIQWITVYNYSYTIVRRVDNVTANIINNSAVYIDQLVTPPLSVNDDGRVYYCEVSINTTFGVSSSGSVLLDFVGT